MNIKVGNTEEKQTFEVTLIREGIITDLNNPNNSIKVSFKFEKDDINNATMSFDGTNWINVNEAQAALQAFMEKYALEFESSQS